MEKYVIIVAGGRGTRMKSDVPKQFMELSGKPVLMRTLERFAQAIPEIRIVVVLAEQLWDDWKALCVKHGFDLGHQLIAGGETRYHSVKQGLSLVPDACVVGIHDAARPLVSRQTILSAFKAGEEKGNAIPVVPVTDSLRVVKKSDNTGVDRNTYFIVQTPQCFHSDLIKKAFQKAYKPEFTDDATVLESFGERINLIEGNRENIKITTSQDLIIAEALIRSGTEIH